MPKLTRFQTSFEFGEISPRLLARVDLAAYGKATKTMDNCYSLIHGGATKRRGTLYVGPVFDETETGCLIQFVYSNIRSFMLVMNGGKLEFIKDQAFVEASPGVRYQLTVPYTEAELPYVQYAQSGNTMYLVHPNHKPKLLQRVTDANWTLTDIPFTYNAVSDVTFSNAFISFKIINGSNVFQEGEYFTITTTAGAISSISLVQNGLTEKTTCVVATTGSNITLSGLFSLDSRTLVAGDRVLVKDQTTPAQNGIYVAAAGAWARATDSDTAAECTNAIVRIVSGSLYSGEWFKQTTTIVTLGTTAQTWDQTTAIGNGQIAGVTSMPGSTTTETWTITCTISTASRQEWEVEGSVSGSPAAYWKDGNYPQTVSFYGQRLFFGGSTQFPQHIWGSGAGDYLNFTVGNRDNDGVIVQIASNDYNALTHLVSARDLMPLTSSTEFSMSGPSNYAISGISSNIVKDHTRNGSNHVKPLRIGREVIFLQRDGKKVRAISYSVTEDTNVAPDITLFAEHLTRTATFTNMAFAADPDAIAWLTRTDGSLCSLTLSREQDSLTAWAQHHTDGSFENVASVPDSISNTTYFIVKRTVDGVERRYIEYFDYIDDGTTTATCFSDCSVVYDGAATTSISGLDHLEGKTVTAIADGVVVPDMVVTGGTVELDYEASLVTIGLPFTATIEMLDPEFGDSSQSTAARAKSVEDIVVKFQDTLGANVNGTVIPFRNTGDLLDTEIEVFTGSKSIKSLGWRSPNNIQITSDTPTPFTVLGVVITALVN